MQTQEISRLIAEGESETVEFKESFGEEALEAIGGFSNSRGGKLLIGVKDSGDICGIQIGKRTVEEIANRIQETTDPRIQPSILLHHLGKRAVLEIQVMAGTGVPVSVRGRYFRRIGRTNQRMSHEEIMQRIVASSGKSWDGIVEKSADLNSLDNEIIQQFISAVKKSGRRPIPDQISELEFLRKMELVQDGHPTRAAILLFSKNPGSSFPSAFLKMGRFRSPVHIVDDREVHGSLLSQLEGAMAWFRERLETEFVISGKPQRDVRWEFPLEAIREALVNAICHRDYSSMAHTQVRLYDDRLEFWNAGELPPGLTPEVLLLEHDSVPRNPKIAQLFFYAGVVERWGSGTTRMAAELKATGLPIPEFLSEPGHFRVAFHKVLFSEAQLKKMGLSERQIKAVVYAKEHGKITNTEYQKVAEVSERTATRELKSLIEKGIFVLEGKTGRGAAYRLKTP